MKPLKPLNRQRLFFFFFVSGFCGLLYQVVWTRLAFAAFGIITPVLSVVISVFMLGLALGSWAGGRWIEPWTRKTGRSAISAYALVEFLIGLGAFAVPGLFGLGEQWLLGAGESGSAKYLLLSAVALALSLLPWCVFMGTTFPLMMAYVQERAPGTSKSFSYLYLANVFGAMSGTLITAFVLIEILGFRHTLWVAAAGNFLIAGMSAWMGANAKVVEPGPGNSSNRAETAPVSLPASPGPLSPARARLIKWILFSTGFVAMAMEVIWTRAFAPVIKTQVYSFALVVATYLGATFAGSWWYRRHLRQNCVRPSVELMGLACFTALLPVLVNDPRLVQANLGWYAHPTSALVLLASIMPFCASLGYLTPGLIDEFAAGQPAGAGRAYAINVLGCILGPLIVSYVILPRIGNRPALLLLSLPFLLFFVFDARAIAKRVRFGLGFGCAAAFAVAWLCSRDFEEGLLKKDRTAVIRRDYAASVLAFTHDGWEKHLLVNGIGMTTLTPITKFMVHLPMAVHRGKPESALIICFGMGTSYRAALSWGVEATSVELIPSVTEAFEYYHADATQVRSNHHGQIVVDDGRRFLRRTTRKFDVIVVDPPPPPEAAGTSLLYSEEFYAAVKRNLNTNGLLQVWVPGGDQAIAHAAVRSVKDSFPYIRCFTSVEGWGTHLLASMEPIDSLTAEELVERMPERARQDLAEWAGATDLATYLRQVVSQETAIDSLLSPDPSIRITDDRPFNEYYQLRNFDPF